MSNHNDINIGCLEFDPMETGRRIRSKRREMHLSLNGLAFCLAARGWEISVNSLGRWERGEVTISWDHALRLARFFRCQLDELVTYREREIDDERDQLVPLYRPNILQFQVERMRIAYVPFFAPAPITGDGFRKQLVGPAKSAAPGTGRPQLRLPGELPKKFQNINHRLVGSRRTFCYSILTG